MSREIEDAKTWILRRLRDGAVKDARLGQTRQDIVDSLHARGMTLETAWAFLKRIEDTCPVVGEVLDANAQRRNRHKPSIDELRNVTRATYGT